MPISIMPPDDGLLTPLPSTQPTAQQRQVRHCDTCTRELPKRAKHKRQCATCIKRAQSKGDANKWRWQKGAEWARPKGKTVRVIDRVEVLAFTLGPTGIRPEYRILASHGEEEVPPVTWPCAECGADTEEGNGLTIRGRWLCLTCADVLLAQHGIPRTPLGSAAWDGEWDS